MIEDKRNLLYTNLNAIHFQQRDDTVLGVLDVLDRTEVHADLVNGAGVHEYGRVGAD